MPTVSAPSSSARSQTWSSVYRIRLMPARLAERVVELAARDGDLDPLRMPAFAHQGRELFADPRQHRARQDCVDHSPAAFELGAARPDQLDDLVRVRKRPLVVAHDPRTDPLEL